MVRRGGRGGRGRRWNSKRSGRSNNDNNNSYNDRNRGYGSGGRGGKKHVEISSYSGKLPSEKTPDEAIVTDIFASFSVPTETEGDMYQQVSIDKISGLLATEYTPEDASVKLVFQNYEPIADLFNWKQEIIDHYNDCLLYTSDAADE